MLAACSDEPLTPLSMSAPGAEARQLSRTGGRGCQSGRMIPPERRGRHKQEMLHPGLQMLSAVPDSCRHLPPHKVLLMRQAYGSSSPCNPSPPSWSGWGGSLQELGRTVEAGKPGCSRHSPALWVGSGQGGPPWAQAAPRGAAQLAPAVWKHILCPALTQHFESRRVTELANSTVWKRWVSAHCRQDAGRTSSDCGSGAPEGFREVSP